MGEASRRKYERRAYRQLGARATANDVFEWSQILRWGKIKYLLPTDMPFKYLSKAEVEEAIKAQITQSEAPVL